MKPEVLKKRYPQFWESVERDVRAELIEWGIAENEVDHASAKTLAHNAAFIATQEHHRELLRLARRERRNSAKPQRAGRGKG